MFKPDEFKFGVGIPQIFWAEGTWRLGPKKSQKGDSGIVPVGVLLTNKKHGCCIDVAWEMDVRTIFRFERHGNVNQQWCLYHRPDGAIVIISKLTGKCMDIQGYRSDDGAPVQQWDYLGNTNQLWTLEPLEDHSFRIRSKHSGKVLDMCPHPLADGGAVVQWEWHGGDNQRWWITHAT